MPANFANLRFLYSNNYNSTTTESIKLVFNLTSLNFDINQASVIDTSPFTSELSGDLKLERHEESNVTSLNSLSKLIDENFDGYEGNTVAVKMTKLLEEEILTSDNFQLDFENVDGNDVIRRVERSNYLQVQINPVQTKGQDPFAFTWAIKLKFHNESLSSDLPAILYPGLVENDDLEISSVDESFDEFNSELKLNYEIQYQSIINTDPNSGSSELVNTIGKAADEITDSISNLTSTINTNLSSTFNTRLSPPANHETNDLALWVLIKKGTEGLSFDNFNKYMGDIFCGEDNGIAEDSDLKKKNRKLNKTRSLPFMNIDAYRCVKIATEAFVMVNCMVDEVFNEDDINDLLSRVPLIDGAFDSTQLDTWWSEYKVKVTGANGETAETIPYLAVIQNKLKDENIKLTPFGAAFNKYLRGNASEVDTCFGILSEKLTHPCFLELIWSYWHEESMMVQGLNAISRRFQNVKGPGRDPFANLEIDPLRPLNNLLWGYIQDEQHRLTVRRRAYEYNHHYGISLKGTAAKNMRFADSRSKFIEAFHRLLNVVSMYYKQADDMTVQPDGFPVLNALKEVHLILSEGAHNQYGDLPSVSRAEMLMQQWLLARPEFREFLPTRIMVAYPEPWMDRVAAINNMSSWTKTSPIHFRDLGRFGEQLLLSIRFGNWSAINDRRFASNWANYWREQIQGYTHAYRAVTGVDLSLEVTRGNGRVDSQQPSVHLYRRLKQQRNTKKSI